MFNQILAIVLSLFVRRKKRDLIVLCFDRNKFLFNTRVFFEYLIENTDKYDVKYIITKKAKRQILEKEYGKKFLSMDKISDLITILKAKVWIVDGGFPIKTPFGHNDRILINFWHGTPIKYIGLDGYKGFEKLRVWMQLRMVCKKYAGFFIVTPQIRDIIKKAFLLDDNKIKLLGQPRNDLLYKKNDKKAIINKLFPGIVDFKKIILYAPTYRGGLRINKQKTKYFPFPDFNLVDFEDFLKNEDIIICVRNHHLDMVEIKETERIKFLNNEKIEDISEILNIFDLLITDYSGMIFDYLLLDRPMLFLPYDLDDYMKNNGMYFNYDEVTPGPKSLVYSDFKKDIHKLLTVENYYKGERDKVSDFFQLLGSGNCERALEFMEEKLNEK